MDLGWRRRRLVAVLPEIFRVETTQLRPSSVGGELPIDLAVDRIARFLPCIDFATKQCRTLDTTIQALTLQNAEFTWLQPPLRASAHYAAYLECRVIALVTMMEDKERGSRVKH